MKKVTLEIDGKSVTVEEGMNLLQAAQQAGADIPTLCYHEKLSQYGACRLCLVEITRRGRKRLVASCCYPVEEGLVVVTSNEKINRIRRTLIQLLLPLGDAGPLRALAKKYGVTSTPYQGPHLDCVLCGLCVRYCEEVKGDHAVYFKGRGIERRLALLPGHSIECMNCEECYPLCPSGWIASGAESMEE